MVELTLALDASSAPTTAQELARATGISHSMVRDVLLRLAASGLLRALPKVGGSRSAQYYEVTDHDAWSRLVRMAEWIGNDPAQQRRVGHS